MVDKIIPPRRNETLTQGGVGLLRFLEYLEQAAAQINTSTEANEADPSSINLSVGAISSLNKAVKELQNDLSQNNNAEVQRLKKRIEQLESVTNISAQISALNKRLDELSNDTKAPFYKTKYDKLTIKSAVITTASVSGTFTATSGTWDGAGIDLLTFSTYKISGTVVLNDTTLGAGVTASSLTSLGSIVGFNAVTNISVDGTQIVQSQGAAVPDASGGATIDAESRTAINDLLARVRAHGLIA